MRQADTAVLDRGATPTRTPSSLREIIDIVPAHCYERSTARGLWLVARSVAFHALVVYGLVRVDAWWAVLLLWLAAGFTTSALFVLGHDAAHEALFDSRRLNGILGRLLMVPELHLFSAWKLGHNHIHHRHTAREGMDFVWHPVTPEEYATYGVLARLRHRVEWSVLGAGLYYCSRIWWSKMIVLSPPKRFKRDIDRDRVFLAVVVAGLAFGAAVLGGILSGNVLGAAWMITKVIIGPFFAFCWFIGFTVYVHHIGVNMPWVRRRNWNKVDAQTKTTGVLRVPRPFDLFFHSIFTHVPHHVDPRIPCYRLDEAQAAIASSFPGLVTDEKLTLRSYRATTKACKVYDFDEGRWYTYRAAGPRLLRSSARAAEAPAARSPFDDAE
jgi:omega-6 fatty acid desaturase (delta-12 desaturase)